MANWPFSNGQSIIGLKLLEFIDWVDASEHAQTSSSASKRPILALPPMQRTAVWRPKQVVDLWDSLIRGLPIGIFYLVEQAGSPRKIVTLAGETKEASDPGFDLLDGQQRVRALLIGVIGFEEEKRCLWVDLGTAEAVQCPSLRITSKAQPFGYDSRTGNKLSLDQRRRGRKRIEENVPLLFRDEAGELRPAYDHELFDSDVIQGGNRIIQPPFPYGASEQTFKLHDLLRAWRQGAPHSPDEGVAALRAAAGNGTSQEALMSLHEAFCRIEGAEVALLRVDPDSFRQRNEDILELFERIGAGGTPLGSEERLYSIYKFHEPYIRDAVNAIHNQSGQVLSPTKIAATALRIANAQTYADRNDTPDVAAFAKAMGDPTGLEFREHLDVLISREQQQIGEKGALVRGFLSIRCLLSYDKGAGHFWIPDVMLASFPAELWQVLAFWAVNHPESRNPKLCREEAVRFALFWHLNVWNNDRAARWAFAHIKTIGAENAAFPGTALYQRFIGNTGDDRCALGLISPEEFESRLCKPPTPKWRTDAERFVKDDVRNEIGSQWWWYGAKMLPWLQKNYIKRVFPGYAPLTDHEDDVPYDVDHMCPQSEWREDWRTLKGRLDVDESLRTTVYNNRDAVGSGIGNLRIIESSTNRSDQDDDVAAKMPFILSDQQPEAGDADTMADSAFAPEHRELWKIVSRSGPLADRRWDENRLKGFQRAVEERAAWLYRRFHDDLGYDAWTSTREDK